MAIRQWPVTSREEWLERRRRNINASEVGALFDCHPYVTRLQLWLEKRGEIEPQTIETKVMRRGRLLEGAVARAVQDERPQWLIEKAEEYFEDDSLRLGATPDFWAMDGNTRIALQTKTVDPFVFNESWGMRPPLWIALQNAVEVMLADCSSGCVGALIVDREFPLEIYDIPRRADVERAIQIRVDRFWRSVRDGVRPKAGVYDAEPLRRLYPESDPETTVSLAGDEAVIAWCEKYLAVKQQIKALEQAKEQMQPEMMERLGAAQYGNLPGYSIAWRTQERAPYQVPAARYRVFDVRRKAEKKARP